MSAAGVGVIGGNGCSWMNQLNNNKSSRKKRVMVSCVSSSASDPYKTLRIQRNASEDEVKKAFRQLALKYHPDVCKGSNCGDKFKKIYNAYDTVMTKLLSESIEPEIKEEMYEYTDIDMFEEWGGWEGAFRF